MHLLAVLDLTTARLFYRIKTASAGSSSSTTQDAACPAVVGREALRRVRQHLPHRHSRVRDWWAADAVELMFLPTYGSWLNWIEAEFAALRLRPSRTDDRSHDEQNRPRSLRPLVQRPSLANTSFAVDSPFPYLDQLLGQSCMTLRVIDGGRGGSEQRRRQRVRPGSQEGRSQRRPERGLSTMTRIATLAALAVPP
jgi:hypothetical protein